MQRKQPSCKRHAVPFEAALSGQYCCSVYRSKEEYNSEKQTIFNLIKLMLTLNKMRFYDAQ
jgi:hypothetical protein